ncbi:MAG: hypothetical protein E7031_03060 [Akkermansiaceae bacterium]|nr:hypothetical protein [Akkermansiaceae bacterium]
MDNLDEYQNRRKAAESRRRKHSDDRKANPVRKGSWWKRFLIRFSIICSILLVVTAICGYAGFKIFTAKYEKWAEKFNLEDINNLDHPCIIYDRNGKEIGRIFDENRCYVTYDQIAPCMIDALVAQEDKNFWTHNGYDPMGILRAAKEALAAGGSANQGASTITQQLARNAYDLERRVQAMGGSRYERKMVEIFLAMRIEEKYSKRQIMEFYLNRIYFGCGYYGIRAASLGYFGKEPSELTVCEAASIAALIKNPENYNPIRNHALNKKWRNDVIDRMQRLDYLTVEEAERLKQTELVLNPRPIRRQTSHLHALIQQQAISIFKDPVRGEEIIKSAGIRIYTTIDKDMQTAAEQSLEKKLSEIESRSDYNHVRFTDPIPAGQPPVHNYLDGAVFAVENKTGATLVYVAGRSFDRANYDFIESGRRPVGTALLPFLYMCAFDNGYSPCSRLVDDALDNRLAGIGGTEGILGEWGMETSKGRYQDSITIRQALTDSKIASAARLGIALSSKPNVGCKPFIHTLLQVGITPPPRNPDSTEANPQYYPRVYLGTEPMSLKQMVMAYTVFPNCGKRPVAPFIIKKITDSNGTILWERKDNLNGEMIAGPTPCSAFRIHSILKDSMKTGSASVVKSFLPDFYKEKVAAKCGTNYDFADASLFAYDSAFTCGVWVGFLNEHSAIYQEAFASHICSPIMGAVFKAAESGKYPSVEILPPSDTEAVDICSASGMRATDHCYKSTIRGCSTSYDMLTYREYFPKGDTSLSSCTVHGKGNASLVDFIEFGSGRLSSSRILPALPILPKAPALIGDDPYGCITTLNPRYKTEEDIAHMQDMVVEEEKLKVDHLDNKEKDEKTEISIPLVPPRPMRSLPVLPLKI